MGSKTVLLIDDSRVSRLLTRCIIARAHPDWQIVEAADGEEGIAQAAACRPDIMFVDVTMPGMNGLAAAAVLRERHPNAAITLLTANIQDTVRQKCRELGIGFLAKPVNVKRVLQFLRDSEGE